MSSRSATVRESTVTDGRAAASSSAAGYSSPAITRLTSVPPCAAIGVVSKLTALPLLLDGEGVQAALGLAGAAPRPRALGLAGRRGAGARPASDARVALVEQRVVGHAIFPDVAPNVRPTPVRQRKHLHDRPAIDLVLLDEIRRRAGSGLILPHRADPGVEADNGTLEGLDLSYEAAAVRIGLVERTRIGQGLELDEIETVPLGKLLLERIRLGEMEAGVEKNHRYGPVDAAEQVRKHHATPTEAHRQGRPSRERVHRPQENRFGIGTPQGNGLLASPRGAKHRPRSEGGPARVGDRSHGRHSHRPPRAPCRSRAPGTGALRMDPTHR